LSLDHTRNLNYPLSVIVGSNKVPRPSENSSSEFLLAVHYIDF